MSGHEPLQSHRAVAGTSDRVFGLVIGAILALIGVWPLVRHGDSPRWLALAPAIVLIGLAIFAKERLTSLNRLWFKLGLAMHSVVSPLVMGALFFLAVMPMAALMRALGKDPLRLKRSDTDSYWIERNPAGPMHGSMKNQF